MTLRLLAASTPSSSLTIGVNTVEETAYNFAPYPLYAEMTSDGNYPRASQFDFDDLTNNTDPDIDYAMRSSMCYWSTGDTGTFRNTRLPDPTFGSKARLDGPFIAYVYDTPGTYTLTANKFDPDGAFGSSSGKTITVVDPTDHFPANRTYLVATDGDYTGAPHASDGDVKKYTSLNDARNAMRTASRTGGVRLCLKKGQTFDDLANPFEQDWADGGVCLIDSFGTGARPIIDVETLNDFFMVKGSDLSTNAWRVVGIDHSGQWDAAHSMQRKSTGQLVEGFYQLKTNPAQASARLDAFVDCTFRNCRMVLNNQYEGSGTQLDKNDADKAYYFFQDCKIQDHGNYIAFGHHRMMGSFFIGSEGAPDPDCCLGSTGRSSLPENYPLNSHGSFRNGWAIMGWWSSSTEDRFGWSGTLNGKTGLAIQQINRNTSTRRLRSVISGCYIGTATSSFLGYYDKNEYMNQILIDKCMFLMAPLVQASVDHILNSAQPGITIRNCMAIRSALPSVSAGNYPALNFTRFQDGGLKTFNSTVSSMAFVSGSSQTWNTPVDANVSAADAAPAILNTSIIDLKSGANGAVDGTAIYKADWTLPHALEERNNFVYAPNLTAPINSGLSLDTTSLGFDSNMGAPAWSWEMAFGTTSGAVADAGTFTISYPDDWYGNATVAADYAGAYTRPRHTIWFQDLYFLRYENATAAFTVGETLDISTGRVIRAVTDQGGGTGVIVFSGGDASVSTSQAITDTGGGAAEAAQGTRPMRMTEYDGTSDNDDDVKTLAMSVTFGGSNITIENTSGFTWPSGYDYSIILDRGTTMMTPDTTFRVASGTLSQYKPTTAITIDAVAEKDVSLEDMGRNLRPGTNHPSAPAGTDSKGPWVA